MATASLLSQDSRLTDAIRHHPNQEVFMLVDIKVSDINMPNNCKQLVIEYCGFNGFVEIWGEHK